MGKYAVYTDTLCNSITATRNSVIKRTSNSRLSSRAPGSAGLLTSSLHLHEAVDMLLYILEKENKRKLGHRQAMHCAGENIGDDL